MDSYHLVLFLHLGALLAAIGASTLVHLSESRLRAASTISEVRQWTTMLGRIGRAFPLAALALLATGGYMMHVLWSWRAGWIDMGVAGIVILFVCGAITGIRGRRLEQELDQTPDGDITPEVARLIRDPLARTLTWTNTALATGVVYMMTMKTSLAGSIATAVISMLIGATIAKLIRRADRKRTGELAGVVALRH